MSIEKQIRREEIAMAIANGTHPDEALALIEAVLDGKAERVGSRRLFGEHFKVYEIAVPMFEDTPTEPCAECVDCGKPLGSTFVESKSGLGGKYHPECHRIAVEDERISEPCKGTGKREGGE